MRIIALADIHGNHGMVSCIKSELENADLILLAGDITNFGNSNDAANIIQAIQKYNQNILAVHGNCDPKGIASYLEEQNISVDCKCKTQSEINVAGVGGVPTGIDGSDFELKLDNAIETADQNLPLVILTHQPTYGTLIDQPSPGYHAGSNSLRSFIENRQPLLAVSGHIHEANGTDKIGKTILVNPGPFNLGYYAAIEIDTKSKTIVDIQLKR